MRDASIVGVAPLNWLSFGGNLAYAAASGPNRMSQASLGERIRMAPTDLRFRTALSPDMNKSAPASAAAISRRASLSPLDDEAPLIKDANPKSSRASFSSGLSSLSF